VRRISRISARRNSRGRDGRPPQTRRRTGFGRTAVPAAAAGSLKNLGGFAHADAHLLIETAKLRSEINRAANSIHTASGYADQPMNPNYALVRSASQRRRMLARRLAMLAGVAMTAASAGPFRLVEDTADGGGQHSQGIRFAVEGSIGQPDTATLQGPRFEIAGGFWRPVSTPVSDTLFHNGFEN
jgi:hypothetical protein